MLVTVLYPYFDHPAIEERYASWQSRVLFQKTASDVDFVVYDPDEALADIAEDIDTEFTIVVTDPLLVPTPGLAERLIAALQAAGTDAAVPVTNETAEERQRVAPPQPYLTMRELEAAASWMPYGDAEKVAWEKADPGVYLCRTETLKTMSSLAGRSVAIARNAYVHRWVLMRAVSRDDLLPLISTTAKSLLELGCGEGALGALIKSRQRCRYVGIELDIDAVAIARRRLDDVYSGDVTEIVSILDELFDCIICSEIVEHVADPWSLLISLREASAPGGEIVISIPNMANASIVNDLLNGRFDYTYIGLACAGHLRFFTRRTIEELMSISGWEIVRIEPQYAPSTAGEELVRRLEASGVEFSKDDLLPSGYYVVGRNPG